MKHVKLEDAELMDGDQVLLTFSDGSVALLTGDELLIFAREHNKLTKVKGREQ